MIQNEKVNKAERDSFDIIWTQDTGHMETNLASRVPELNHIIVHRALNQQQMRKHFMFHQQ